MQASFERIRLWSCALVCYVVGWGFPWKYLDSHANRIRTWNRNVAVAAAPVQSRGCFLILIFMHTGLRLCINCWLLRLLFFQQSPYLEVLQERRGTENSKKREVKVPPRVLPLCMHAWDIS
jgi:hypothetical protein